MERQKQTYQQRIAHFQLKRKKAAKASNWLTLIRLIIFITTGVSIYLLWPEYKFIAGIALTGIILFFMAVAYHQRLNRKKQYLSKLININKEEKAYLDGELSLFGNGQIYKDDEHDFSNDLDLFGQQSLFQRINRTALSEGEQELADTLKSNATNSIVAKQQLIKELAGKIDFRQSFTAEASLVKSNVSNQSLINWLKNYQVFTPRLAPWLSLVFSVLSVAFISLLFLGYLEFKHVLLWLLIGIGITGIYLKRINVLLQFINETQSVFQQYKALIRLIENTNFTSKKLYDIQSDFKSGSQNASNQIHKLTKLIDALEQRNNLLMGIFLNGFLLWDIRLCHKIEKWIIDHGPQVEKWLDAIVEVDAQNSLATFAYNHNDYTYPQLTERYQLKVTNLIHPSLDQQKAVGNSIEMSSEDFLIITGANMAGKSTFLRSIGTLIIMANSGLPVAAEHCEYQPIKLISSMRTADSLASEASYFYAELARLKKIIDKIEGQKHFIILDEILKGTNSEDKARGSQKFVERLIKTRSTGLIATHDLSLCQVADQHETVSNYHFDAQIIKDELYFDYQLKEGVCQNMNASFLLKKMKIVK
ncbi:MAG: DNA mismatch repair protein MutS [Psychroflexus sp.]|jgi:DNA mismatch repair ATPase MutS|nr:DNA mismatch repair protein MutS [Psychroflexus sp.]MDR9447922.1 DNA mismatch repair protein MutS [Psychroflexus sp.]